MPTEVKLKMKSQKDISDLVKTLKTYNIYSTPAGEQCTYTNRFRQSYSPTTCISTF